MSIVDEFDFISVRFTFWAFSRSFVIALSVVCISKLVLFQSWNRRTKKETWNEHAMHVMHGPQRWCRCANVVLDWILLSQRGPNMCWKPDEKFNHQLMIWQNVSNSSFNGKKKYKRNIEAYIKQSICLVVSGQVTSFALNKRCLTIVFPQNVTRCNNFV